ncbi:Trypsin-like peptidase domain-containing protein [Chitinophaga sp. CF118]|uniref:VWA domain-containing protein n=1 Tax=Chitinophaga sp. CF118 TaxID=1884367 RepID=UPI0008F064C1|nr:VWA domain-containing protein [Chitinophaga sp. CF118]SFF02796.1 Trypsin-like peptidase domain-containing protein [Chitinophaga sp. CF118]
MSHVTGTVQPLPTPLIIGPDAGLPTTTFHPDPAPAPGGLKFAILHFTNAIFPANNRLEVDLGYDMDVFTAADGTDFWTRPINVSAFSGGNIPIRYITNGAPNGSVNLIAYGRGERHAGIQDPTALSNSDPFLLDATYVEPDYDPFWFCTPPNPNWENIRCETNTSDIRRVVARSVGMIIHADHDDHLSTCSVTLIAADLIIFAGHCISDDPLEIGSASVIFNYETECGGARPVGYSPMFFKVKKLVKHRFSDPLFPGFDYCVLQLKTPPSGIPIPPIQMRHDLPGVGEQVFGVHHPNGAVKKLSRPHTSFATITSSNTTGVRANLDVSGGSSGSGLFDTSGRILGVLSNGGPCNLSYFPVATALQDIASTATPSPARDVMIVFDRSGSMSLSAGTGKTKIQEARDATSLFVQLIRAGAGHRIGLVSFSTSAPVPPASPDFGVTAVSSGAKMSLIGPAPFSAGIVGSLTPGGNTTIGGGLQAAHAHFPAPGSNQRTILLMTDGLQNTPPMIDTVEPSLGDTDINVIGFGTESSLDGTLLSRLSERHNGIYTRAGDPLALKKFFAMAFGNIFESGTLADPNYFLPASAAQAKPVAFSVCGEETITIVVGWDKSESQLYIELISPGGVSISPGTAGIESSTGNTWTFMRVSLPHTGERDGTWQVIVHRVFGGGEFPPPQVDLNYFINIIAKGGPMLRFIGERKKYYTGDSFNPIMVLRYDNGTFPENVSIKVTATRPADSIGNVLSKARLRNPSALDADTIPARQATMIALEAESGNPIVKYTDDTFDLLDDPANTGGVFESHGILGRDLKDLLRTEGNYTFHALAKYGDGCIATRELMWSIHVDCGIDASNTTIQTTVIATLPDGKQEVKITVTPKDKYGNNLGPGRTNDLPVTGTPGSSVTGVIEDNGDGTYSVVVIWDPTSGTQPGVIITQPGRPPVVAGVPCPPPPPKENCKKWKKWFYLLLLLLLFLLLIAGYLLIKLC